MPLISLGKVAKLSRYAVQCLQLDSNQFVLVYKNQQFYLLDNLCLHKAAALCEGDLQRDTLSCPWHQAHFDIRTGQGAFPISGWRGSNLSGFRG